MFGIGTRKFETKTKEELQKITRILIIDDKKSDIDENLRREGWVASYIDDAMSMSQNEIRDAQIICVDINGVGAKLGFTDEGMGLARAIKKEYPAKRIILYSTQQNHNIFNDALDFVDRKVYKSGEFYPFLEAVSSLAKTVFDWETCVDELYIKYKKGFPKQVSYDLFKASLEKGISNKKFDPKKLMETTGIVLEVAGVIKSVVELCLTSN